MILTNRIINRKDRIINLLHPKIRIINNLNQEIKVVLQSPDTEKRFVNEGAEPQVKTPAELGKYVSDEMAKWVELARIAGIRGE